MDPETSIIIRSYNEEKHIEKLLIGITKQRLKTKEIILIDSGSTDKTVEIAKKYNVKILRINKKDFTFGGALNIGCNYASSEILVFVSAHVYPLKINWLEKLISPFQSRDVLVSYGKQIGNHKTKFSEHQIFRKWFPNISYTSNKNYFCNNANCSIRKNIWKKYNFNEDLTGLEDLDLAKKIVDNNEGKISYISDAEIVHVHEESWVQIRNRYRRESIALLKINPKLKIKLFQCIILFFGNVYSDLFRAIKEKILIYNLIPILLFRFNQFYGIYLGFNMQININKEIRDKFFFPLKNFSKNEYENKNNEYIDYTKYFKD